MQAFDLRIDADYFPISQKRETAIYLYTHIPLKSTAWMNSQDFETNLS